MNKTPALSQLLDGKHCNPNARNKEHSVICTYLKLKKVHITYTFSCFFFLHIQVASAILRTCMDLADCGSYFSYDHAASNTPTLQELLSFPGQEKQINIPQEIGTQYKIFGTFLLENDDRAKLDNL